MQLKLREKEIVELKNSDSVKKQLIEDGNDRFKQLSEKYTVINEDNAKLLEASKQFETQKRNLELELKIWQNRVKEKDQEIENLNHVVGERYGERAIIIYLNSYFFK